MVPLWYIQPKGRRKDVMEEKTNEVSGPKKYLISAKMHSRVELIFLRMGGRGTCFIVNISWWWQMKFSFICFLRPHSWSFPDFFSLLSWLQTLSLEILIILPCTLSIWINYYFIYSHLYKIYLENWHIRSTNRLMYPMTCSITWLCSFALLPLPLLQAHRLSHEQTTGGMRKTG